MKQKVILSHQLKLFSKSTHTIFSESSGVVSSVLSRRVESRRVESWVVLSRGVVADDLLVHQLNVFSKSTQNTFQSRLETLNEKKGHSSRLLVISWRCFQNQHTLFFLKVEELFQSCRDESSRLEEQSRLVGRSCRRRCVGSSVERVFKINTD
jgi:hypothetical protein